MKNQLTAPYGRINMDILKRDDISPKQKLIYAVIAIKQGETEYAKLTNIKVADAVGCTPKYVSSSVIQMENLKLLKRVAKGKIHAIAGKGQYGMVELDMLITANISGRAKYLYLIYCAAGNDYDANMWGRKGVCANFHISHSTYQKAHKELLDNGILQTIGRLSGNGIQTSNINIIIRTDKWEIKRPPSWVPSEAFDLNNWCLENLDKEGRVQPELVDSDSIDGTGDATQEDEGMQRTVTINNNLNSVQNSTHVLTNESFTTLSVEKSEKELNIELLEEVTNRKLKTPDEARKVIDVLNESDFSTIIGLTVTDDDIQNAFSAFEYYKQAVSRYGQDTFGYALNIQDIRRFMYSILSHGFDFDEIEYHIDRVVELGFEKVKRPYIGFSYAIKADAKYGPKQPPR